MTDRRLPVRPGLEQIKHQAKDLLLAIRTGDPAAIADLERFHLQRVAPFTELLLDHGADPNARASLRKKLHPGYGEDRLHEYRDVTPLTWGERFHGQIFVSCPAMRLLGGRGRRSSLRSAGRDSAGPGGGLLLAGRWE